MDPVALLSDSTMWSSHLNTHIMAYELNTPYLIKLYGIVSKMNGIYKEWHNQIDWGKIMLWGQVLSCVDFQKVNAELYELAASSI